MFIFTSICNTSSAFLEIKIKLFLIKMFRSFLFVFKFIQFFFFVHKKWLKQSHPDVFQIELELPIMQIRLQFEFWKIKK